MTTPSGPFKNVRGEREVRPIGGDNPVQLMRGMEGVLRSNDAAAREVANAASEMRILNERTLRMYGSVEAMGKTQQAVLQSITDSVTKVTNEVLSKLAPTVTAVADATRQAQHVNRQVQQQVQQQSATPPVAPPVTPPPAPTVAGTDIPRDPLEDQKFAAWMRQRAEREAAKNPTRPSGTAHMTERDRQERDQAADGDGSEEALPSNWDTMQRGRGYSIGQLRQDVTRGLGRAMSESQFGPQNLERNAEGQLVHRGTTTLADEATANHFLRNERIANRIRTVGGNVADQGAARGIINSLPEGAGRFLGVAGAAYAIGHKGWDFANDQAKANREWTAITGGNQADAFRERSQGAMFRQRQRFTLGGMSGDDADRLYRGVAEIDPADRGFRQDAMSLATENFRKFGMQVSESLSLIRTSAENGSKNLSAVADALDGVSQAAHESGMNAADARKQFAQTFEVAAPALTGSGTAAMVSGALVSAQQRLGPQYSDLSNTGQFGEMNMRMLAAQQGTTYAQFLGNNQGQQGGLGITRAMQAQTMNMANSLLGDTGNSIIEQYRSENGITGALTPEQAKEVQTRILQSGAVDPGVAASVIGNFGGPQGLDPNDAVGFLVQSVTGGYNPEGEAQDKIDASKMRDINAPGQTTQADAIGRIHGGTGGLLSTSSSQARSQYGAQQRNKESGIYGKRSPIIEKMLKQGDGDQRFKIKVVENGQTSYREMNANDAIRFHADQLARGDVEITRGSGAGGTLADYEGMAVDEDVTVHDHKGGRKKGEAYKPGGSGKGGSVQVVPSPELAKLLRFVPQGNVTVTDGPPPSRTDPRNYPTGRVGP